MVAFVLGLLGGAWHLVATAHRARMFTRGNPLASTALLPVAMLGPVGAVWLSIQLHPASVWAVLPGLITARAVLIRRLEAGFLEDPWTQ